MQPSQQFEHQSPDGHAGPVVVVVLVVWSVVLDPEEVDCDEVVTEVVEVEPVTPPAPALAPWPCAPAPNTATSSPQATQALASTTAMRNRRRAPAEGRLAVISAPSVPC